MGSTISTTDRELNRIVEKQARELGTSKSEVLRTLAWRGLGQGASPALSNAAPPSNPGPTQSTDNEASQEEDRFSNIVVEWDEKVEAVNQHSRDIEDLEVSTQAQWEAIESLKQGQEDQKELLEGTMLAIDKLVDQAVENQDALKAFLDFSKRIVTRLESEETPEAPPEASPEEEELVRLVLEDEATLDEISGRVLESLAKDLDAEKDEVYQELVGEVRETLSAIRVSDGEKHVRLFQMGQKMDNLVGRIEALTTEVPPREKPKVEARTVPAPPKETYEDILVVCAHGGKGLRTGFTADDRKANVTFCPHCGWRITYT